MSVTSAAQAVASEPILSAAQDRNSGDAAEGTSRDGFNAASHSRI
ncbi:hypothetical protein [Microbacterium sp. CH12i]|nr:hypothetical protein [Microbacterium sp. CH12i]